MKVKNEARYQENRERILRHARSLIVNRGIDNVSLREIARKSGYSPASLYEYFPDKDSIFRELAGQAEQAFYLALQTAYDDPLIADPRGKILEIGAAYFRFAMQNREDFLLIFSEFRSVRRNLEEEIVEQSSYFVLVRAVSEFLQSKTMPVDTETVSFGLWSLIHGAVMLKLTHLRDFELDFEEAVREIGGVYLNGCC